MRILIILVLSFMVITGCDRIAERRLIPKQKLTPQQEKMIKEAIDAVSKFETRRLIEIGRPAVPMIIERIFENYKSRPRFRNPRWDDATNLIGVLSEIKDKRAVPALIHIMLKKKYRCDRGWAAYTLGQIGDRRAIEPLWKAFEIEKGYLEAGDNKGPDYGWGLPSNFTSKNLERIGIALEKLGENPGEFPRSFLSRHERFKRGLKERPQQIQTREPVIKITPPPRKSKGNVIEGVMYSKNNPVVTIDGEMYHLHDSVRGGEITNISPDKITVKFKDIEKDYEVGEEIK